MELFPVKYPIICGTPYLGGILMHITMDTLHTRICFYHLYSIVSMQFFQNLSHRPATPSVYQLEPEFRSENAMMLAGPTGMF